jgi:repressor LexA
VLSPAERADLRRTWMPAVLTDLERKILDYMVRYLRMNTYQPSIREIGEEFDIKSTKTVSEHLGALAEKGYLERDPSRSRGVRILGVDLSPETVSVPCFMALPDSRNGFISDGVDAYYSVDRRMAGAKGCYFLRARGDAFRAAGIESGDFVLVEPADPGEVRDGDLVVAHSGEAPGLFRYARNGRTHSLRSSAADQKPLLSELWEELQITGRVTGLYRRFDGVAVPVSATAH